MFGGALASGLVHDDEPVVVVAAGEERRHLGRRTVAEVRAGVEGRVVAGPVGQAPDRRKPGGRNREDLGGARERGLGSSAEDENRDGRRLGKGGGGCGGEEAFREEERESGAARRGGGHSSS